MRRFIKDNRGMTLIELIIAITILGLVATPLLHGFLTSAQTEVKARKMGEVTSVAQNVMEVVEGAGYDTLKNSTSAELCTLFGIDTTLPNGGSAQIVTPQNGTSNISLTGLDSGNKMYNATVDITPHDINNEDLSEYTSMDVIFQVPKSNVSVDRTISLSVTQEGDIITFVLTNDAPSQEDEPENDENDSDSDGTDNENNGNTSEETEGTIPRGTAVRGADEFTYKYRLPASGEMPSVYLFYYPNYKIDENNDYIAKKDILEINNYDNVEFDLILVKQLMTGKGAPNGSMQLDELEKRSVLEIVQYISDDEENGKGVSIYTNAKESLRYTLYGNLEQNGINSNICDVSYVVEEEGIARNGKFGNVSKNTTANSIVKEDNDMRAYEYTVKVYGDGEVLCTMTGTILD